MPEVPADVQGHLLNTVLYCFRESLCACHITQIRDQPSGLLLGWPMLSAKHFIELWRYVHVIPAMVGGDEPRVAWGRTRLHVAEFARTHMLKPGQKAPKFKAKTQNDEYISLDEILADGSGLVLFFYPKDSTPGCTKEACDFRDAFAEFKQSGYKILGVSKDLSLIHI